MSKFVLDILRAVREVVSRAKDEKDFLPTPKSCETPSNSTDTLLTVVGGYSLADAKTENGDTETTSPPPDDARLYSSSVEGQQGSSDPEARRIGAPRRPSSPVPPPGLPGFGKAVVLPPKPPSDGKSGRLVEGFLKWGMKYALENLARAQDNEVFPLVVEQLQVNVYPRPKKGRDSRRH